MRTLELSSLRYSINWLAEKNDLKKFLDSISLQNPQAKHFVITSNNIYQIYEGFLEEIFVTATILQIEDGEQSKSMDVIEKLCSLLLQHGADRKSILWAFGGGVIGDITGFAAAVFMRGISFVQVPTTLLAMVDSSVGGKTAVNLPTAKNLIGCFYQPISVFIHISFLQTLPHREILCGLAEAIKSALLMDKDFFSYLETQAQKDILPQDDPQFLNEISYRSIRLKAQIVEQDEKESGLRAILNLGHTLAHALESYYDYETINHGEAVSIGLHFAVWVSTKEVQMPHKQAKRVVQLLKNFKMPLLPSDILELDFQVNKLIELIKQDKKNQQEKIFFVLLRDIGVYQLPVPVPEQKLKFYLEKFLS